MAIKISSRALATNAVEFQLVDPASEDGELWFTEEGKPVLCAIYGSASEQFRKAFSAAEAKKAARGKRKPTDDEIRADNIELWVSCTSHFTELVNEKGEPLNTPERIKEVFHNPEYQWLVTQVADNVIKQVNFIKKS